MDSGSLGFYMENQNPTGKPRISIRIGFLGSGTKLVGTWIVSKGQHQKMVGTR